MITTTLNRIKEHGPCKNGWGKLLKYLDKTKADDESLPYYAIVKSNGLYDALWCCRAEPKHDKEWRLYAVWCARQVEHLITDERSKEALNVAERYANGNATDEELAAVRAAAWAAAWAAARAAVRAAVRDAWDAVWAARDDAWAAVWAARDAARDAQKKKFLEIVGGE